VTANEFQKFFAVKRILKKIYSEIIFENKCRQDIPTFRFHVYPSNFAKIISGYLSLSFIRNAIIASYFIKKYDLFSFLLNLFDYLFHSQFLILLTVNGLTFLYINQMHARILLIILSPI
jgi:hypothetical protein